jgi:hypothetical protein
MVDDKSHETNIYAAPNDPILNVSAYPRAWIIKIIQ